MDKGQIEVESLNIVSNTGKYDLTAFRQRLKKRGLSAPKIFDIAPEPDIANKRKDIEEISSVSKKDDMEETGGESKVTVSKIGKVTLPGEKKPRKKREKKPIEEIVLEVPATLIEVDDVPIGDRMPPKEPSVNIKAPAYYLNNREYFINFINSIFKKYADTLKIESKQDITCDDLKLGADKGFNLMIHQQIVRDYINLYTPYRGLLLYHGLGAGKTCASIAIAEGIKNENRVFVMTPASLRTNYLSELKHCGDPIYKINQYWEKVNTNGNLHIEKALSEVLNLSVAHIRKKGWVWMVNVKKPSNFESLSAKDQKSIDTQINIMMQHKYTFINYNGIRHNHLDNLIRERAIGNNEEDDREEGDKKEDESLPNSNPFDNSVIVIDEAHNFVSRIVNKIKSSGKIRKNKQTPLAIRLYELILNANNCRVVFLTGTPIINYPNEIGVLFNMLRGYIKTYYFKLETNNTRKKINQKYITDLFKKEKIIDYIEYRPSKTTLIVTRNPFGFINKLKKKGENIVYAGVSSDMRGQKNDTIFQSKIFKVLSKNKISIIKQQSKVENHKALPDTLEVFKNMFINKTTGEITDANLFKRRIIGLTSYFRSASESLLPTYSNIPKVFHIEMSDHQLGLYESARAAERREEKRNATKKIKQGPDIYAETKSSYRIFSRAFCNFVFPNVIVKDKSDREYLLNRPMPKSEQTIEDAISTKRTKEERKAGIKKTELDEDVIDGATLEDKLQNIDGLYSQDDSRDIDKNIKEQTDSTYKERIDKALKLLELHADKYLSPSGLAEYSPKFLQILKNIQNKDNVGLHLLYTQFRRIEGIGVFSRIMDQNGFTRFKISNASGTWQLDIAEIDKGKQTYALYTGTETADEKEIIRNIFNGSWDSIPSTLAAQLREKHVNNNLGEVIKVLMITSSGSEGITLKNTRFVHIVEPYWHPVRTDQVIGRARRICSHKDLPIELRTVEVFIYLMTFKESQIKGNPNAEEKQDRLPKITTALRDSKADKSKIDRKTLFTSDETLYEISNIKKTTTNSILKAIKESSVDCVLHSKSNSKEGLMCYSFGSPTVKSFSYKPNFLTEEKDIIQKQNLEGEKWEGYPITISGVKRVLKRENSKATGIAKKIGMIYDLESYEAAKVGKGNPVLIGRIRENPTKPGKLQFLKINHRDF